MELLKWLFDKIFGGLISKLLADQQLMPFIANLNQMLKPHYLKVAIICTIIAVLSWLLVLYNINRSGLSIVLYPFYDSVNDKDNSKITDGIESDFIALSKKNRIINVVLPKIHVSKKPILNYEEALNEKRTINKELIKEFDMLISGEISSSGNICTIFIFNNQVAGINLKKTIIDNAGSIGFDSELHKIMIRFKDNVEISAKLVMILGIAYMKQEKYDKALECYKGINVFECNFYSGLCYAKLNKYEKAIEYFKNALINQPKSKKTYFNLATAYMKMGLNEKAIENYKLAIDIDGKYEQAYFNLGVAYESNKQFYQAIDVYKRILVTLNKSNFMACNNLASCLSDYTETLISDKKEKTNKEILAYYSKAIEINPKYWPPYVNRGVFNAKNYKNYNDAIVDIKKAIDLSGGDAIPYVQLGCTYLNMFKFDDASKQFKKAIDVNPKHELAYLNLAETFTLLKKYSAAEKIYKKLIKLNPNNMFAYAFLYDLYICWKKPNQIAALIKIIYEKYCDKLPAVYVSACSDLFNGDYKESINKLSEIIKRDPEFILAHERLAVVYIKLNQFENAEQELLKAIALNNLSKESHCNLGYIYILKKNYVKSLEEFNLAYLIDEKFTASINGMVSVYLQNKDIDLAEKFARKALKTNANDAIANNNFGLILMNRGHKDLGQKYLIKAKKYLSKQENNHTLMPMSID